MKAKIIVLLAVCSSLLHCSNPKVDERNILTLHPNQFTTINELNSIIDTMLIIDLEEDSTSLITLVQKMIKTNTGQFIILDKNGVFAFNCNGKFLHKIGANGRGPGEYITVRDICLSKAGDQIIVLDGMNKILCYSAESGEYTTTVEPKWNGPTISADAIAPSASGGYYLFTSNPADFSNFTKPYYCLHKFNHKGEYEDMFLERKDFVFSMGLITQNEDNKYLIRPQEGGDVCYELSEEVKERFIISFEDKATPLHYAITDNGDLDIGKYRTSKYYKRPSYVHENQNYITFSAAGPNANTHNYIYAKNSKAGVHYNSVDIDPYLPIFTTSDKDYFYCIVYTSVIAPSDTSSLNPLTRYIMNNFTVAQRNNDKTKIIGIRYKL